MVGGHFDSWQGATGATDNGTGSSVALEAVRILAAAQAHGTHGPRSPVEW